ncbi:H(+)/Cl(-) exchange transporter ClcA [Camelimonas sp. ID_303_24]
MLAAFVGAVIGLIGSGFHLAIDHLSAWPQWLATRVAPDQRIWCTMGVTMLATVLSVFLVRRFAPEAGGSGVQELEGAVQGIREVRWQRVLPVKFAAGVAAISSGLVLGREGPTIHIGASVSAAAAEATRCTEIERRGLLAAGAGAGLACAFNAPLAGALFVLEETRKQFPYSFRTYMGVIAAAITSTIVTQAIAGTRVDLPVIGQQAPLASLPAFALLGVVLGVLGVALNAALLATLDLAAACNRRVPYLWPALVGLGVGALLTLAPQTVTGGETVIMKWAAQTPALPMLLTFVVMRFITMVGSYSAGTPGGVFAPILALAVCAGMAFGVLVELAVTQAGFIGAPGDGASPLAFGMAAMAALFTASIRAPLVGVVLALELTGSYGLTLAMLCACLTANLTAQWLGGRPLYEQLLERTLRLEGKTLPPEGAAVGLASAPGGRPAADPSPGRD